jgi:hypothetical protein
MQQRPPRQRLSSNAGAVRQTTSNEKPSDEIVRRLIPRASKRFVEATLNKRDHAQHISAATNRVGRNRVLTPVVQYH